MNLKHVVGSAHVVPSGNSATLVNRHMGRALAIVFFFWFGLNVFVLEREGVFRNEFSAESDEPAHFTSALMVHDYVRQGFPSSPLDYARQFYLHYPKVAIGHWPPVFYVIQAIWMLIFGVSRESVFCLMAALAAGTSTSLFWLVHRVSHSALLSFSAGSVFLLLPLVRSYTGTLMTDLLVAAFSWWALIAWVRFMESGHSRYAYISAVLLAAGILSKGNAYAALAIPFVALFGAGRWDLLRNRTFWFSIGLVFLLTAPWSLYTKGLVAPTFQYKPGIQFFLQASLYYFSHLGFAAGLLTSLLALVGIWRKVLVPLPQLAIEPVWGCALGAIMGVQVFHSLVPAGLEPRYLIASLPPLLLFTVAGLEWCAGWLPGRLTQPHSWLAAAWLVVLLLTEFRLVHKPGYGFRQLAQDLASRPELKHSAILCTSEFNGEGMLVTEMALLDPQRPSHLVLRGSRLLADSDWNGLNYKWRVAANAPAVQDLLEQVPVNVVVVDHVPGREFPHHRVLLQVVDNPAHWKLFRSYPSGPARVDVYIKAQLSTVDPRDRLRVSLTPSPHIFLQKQ